jgi:DNA-binding PadR family transcriptional regulator
MFKYIFRDIGARNMKRVMGVVPRGFTRVYVLRLLKEKPMTGKEIIEESERRSGGEWRPSPGLIYPLLGRLMREGLIEEVEGGRFAITPKGERALERYLPLQDQLWRQMRLVTKLGLSAITTGKLLAEEALSRLVALTEVIHDVVGGSSRSLRMSFYTRYKEFLRRELERLEGMEEPAETAEEEREEG